MKKKIIVAPLNWGLGHATRCVPIINALIKENYTPVIASDGNALKFLKHEFSDLETLVLPSYHIKYGKNLKRNLFLQLPTILKAIKEEERVIAFFVAKNRDVVGVISDNRFGVRSSKIPSVYITHQLNVLSGFTTYLTSSIHQKIINKFDTCWIPDNSSSNFSGKLSISNRKLNQKFIGVLSRFKKEELEQKIAVLVIISGPEPNRTFLEEKLIAAFKNDKRKVVFVLGRIEEAQKEWTNNNCTFYNFLLSEELEKKINSSEVIVCRSGYSSILDVATLGKKVFFIPTKNQPEQEYLANYLQKKHIAPFSKIEDFTSEKLKEVERYAGFKSIKNDFNSDLFCLFHRKRKL
ncbi:glycosyltransferase [Polaribacter sp. IC073]|uniref:glycosyltransferase n=1 Tax=Polaribacter sp. IC073 TaxID=2508540 RepID=UPI0011BE6A95|nr:glycosyltransferase [Polaribacter sp. IC073]TXD49689.1 glycosyltransferase [Polaribacter sp. IC073]